MRVDLGLVCIDYGHYSLRVIAQGELPNDRHTFGLIMQSPEDTKIFKEKLPIWDMIFLPGGHEMDVFLSRHALWACISFDRSFFENSFWKIAGDCAADLPTHFFIMALPPHEKNNLNQLLSNILFQHEPLLAGQEHPENHNRLVENLLLICSKALIESIPIKKETTSLNRLQLVHRVEDFFRQNNFDRIKITDICQLFNVSIRTLEYAFKEVYGVSPLKYLKLRRLNTARQILLESNPDTSTVTEIAMKAHFWHLSQFASDYRSLFSETPSQTLQKTFSLNHLI